MTKNFNQNGLLLILILKFLSTNEPQALKYAQYIIIITVLDKSSAVAEMGDRGHNRHRLKKRWEAGGYCAPFMGELGPRLKQCGLGRGLLPYQVASASIQPFGHNRHEPKTGRCAPLEGAATPSNTTSPGPRSASVPSGILIHPAVWPQ